MMDGAQKQQLRMASRCVSNSIISVSVREDIASGVRWEENVCTFPLSKGNFLELGRKKKKEDKTK